MEVRFDSCRAVVCLYSRLGGLHGFDDEYELQYAYDVQAYTHLQISVDKAHRLFTQPKYDDERKFCRSGHPCTAKING